MVVFSSGEKAPRTACAALNADIRVLISGAGPARIWAFRLVLSLLKMSGRVNKKIL